MLSARYGEVEPTMPPPAALSPSQLNAIARDLLESGIAQVQVQGEISNLARPSSGHLYFTLKDAQAQVRCAMFRPKSQWLKLQPANGMSVLASGRATLYEARGEFQLVLDHLEEAGEGALRREFEALRRRLEDEGLFAAARKRPLPPLLHRVGVLSSPSGAAIRDVLAVISRRWPLLAVELLPVPVQGSEAAAKIRAMLQRADASGRYDALLLTRGGGSLEDLWCFNDESLARAIAALRTPMVSAIGHEIDTTLCDLVADLRAPTPSAAAELLVPDRAALNARLDNARQRLRTGAARRLRDFAQRSDRARLALEHAGPQARLQRGRQRGEQLRDRLRAVWSGSDERRTVRLRAALARVRAQHPQQYLRRQRRQLKATFVRLRDLLRARQERAHLRCDGLSRALVAMNPMAIAERGYTLLQRTDDNRLVRAWDEVSEGERLHARLARGALELEVRRCLPPR